MAADAARDAGQHVAFDATNDAPGQTPSLPADPLSRLEAELGATGGDLPEGKRLHAETWGLLEEAWSLVTECLVIRDSLLEACQEVERTMGGIQDRLGAMAAASEPTVSEDLGNGHPGNGDLGDGHLGNNGLGNNGRVAQGGFPGDIAR